MEVQVCNTSTNRGSNYTPFDKTSKSEDGGHSGGILDTLVTYTERPVRRRLHGLPQFVVVRGGEYCFMPGLRALKWLAALHDKDPNSETL